MVRARVAMSSRGIPASTAQPTTRQMLSELAFPILLTPELSRVPSKVTPGAWSFVHAGADTGEERDSADFARGFSIAATRLGLLFPNEGHPASGIHADRYGSNL